MNEKAGLKGIVHYRLIDSEGNVKNEFDKTNLIAKAGVVKTVKLMTGAASDAFSNIAIGTGGGGAAITSASTHCNNEYKRGTATVTQQTTSFAGDTGQFLFTFSFTESKAISESCVLNSASGGDMLAIQTFADINVSNGDTLEITWKVSMA